MKICLRPETCNHDMRRLKIFARDVGVDQLWYFPSIAECRGADGMMDSRKLIAFKDQLAQDNLNLAITSETITTAVLQGDFAELESVRRGIQASAAAAIDTVFIIFNFFAAGKDAEPAWHNLVEFHKRVIETAEKSRVRIAVHGLWNPEHFVYSVESYERLLQAAPSEYNGITFCMGVLHQAGENVVRAVHRFGRKIFFVHVRDIIGRGDDYREVFLGDGEVDVPGVVAALRGSGYAGLLCPEHFPKIVDEPYMGERSTALCVGYLKGLLSALRKREAQ